MDKPAEMLNAKPQGSVSPRFYQQQLRTGGLRSSCRNAWQSCANRLRRNTWRL